MLGIVPTTAQAAPAAPAAPPVSGSSISDVTERSDKVLPLDGEETPSVGAAASARKTPEAAAGETPAVGTVRQWLGDDDYNGRLYRKDYTLRAVGTYIEVWVANDLAFPAGDCRNQIPNSTVVTDAQAEYLANQFDTNMYPKETATFSTPPDRDGSNALLGPDGDGNGGDYTGDGKKTVALIDNVRDDNYYTFPAAPTYIAGFFSSQFNELFDRNVMTIDAFDWAHRSGPDVPDEPTADLCTSRPARANLYEGTFAHEWQHLLMYYTDPFEVSWINEGLSDFAQTLTGYVNAQATVFEKGADSHIYCYQGFGPVQTPYNPNPRDCGGPENSLTLWGDGANPNTILADYGEAYSFMLYLYDHYGEAFMSALHRDGERQGIASLQYELAQVGVKDAYQVLHDFQSSTLLDQLVGQKGSVLIGSTKRRVTTPSLNSTVNLDNPASYATPGAAPNGADYVLLKDAAGKPIKGKDVRSLSFLGAQTLPTLPLAWTIVSNDPDRAGNPVLFSGNASNTDATAVTSVAVPAADPTLKFLAKYGAEAGYDYGYVMVSTDGGVTYTPIAGDKTVTGKLGPALNGTTTGFEPHSYDLSAYAGQTVLLGFRYVSDGGVNEGGLLLDDITVGGTLISDGSSLAPFKSLSEVHPTPVANWNVKLVGINSQLKTVLQIEVNGDDSFSVSGLWIRLLLGLFPQVVVMVAYDDPTEQAQQYAPYALTVNGVVQAGGGQAPTT